ncbi:hypothetical protein Fmac_030664 [Flemingia macrophylla]|uniref:Fe2OG dioxygenase domain-containing protein n=1 Tax=Flemingia macrophylla TaxID=520843 RepID=A0ABD1L0B2_9FABA
MEEVKGLWLCPNFLSGRRQSLILLAMEADKWFPNPSINQAMRFGLHHLPSWALSLAHSIRRAAPSAFPAHLLLREPLFDQMIANVYQPREGICAHVDLLRFDDGIAILSLESSCVMHFTPLSHSDAVPSVPVLLAPGSLILMWGEARYQWKHEINRTTPAFQTWKGHQLTQSKRTSITLRKLSSSSS